MKRPPVTTDDPLLFPREVAARFGCDSKAVYRWTAAGKLHPVRSPSGRRLYRTSEVDALFEAVNSGKLVTHRPYPHAGFGQACGACSQAAGGPVGWPCAVGAQ